MKYSYALLGMILFGMTGLVFIVLFEAITINNESEYYTLKETTQAAMYDSIDLSYYRINGKLKISEQKFIENFTKRFANNILGDVQKYELKFYDIMESPPKVTVVVNGQTSSFNLTENNNSFDIINNLTAILGYDNENVNCDYSDFTEYYYSYVPSNTRCDNYICEITNANLWNIKGLGQIIMPYIYIYEDTNNFDYNYYYIDDNLVLYKDTSAANNLYNTFTSKCGYPLYRQQDGSKTWFSYYSECIEAGENIVAGENGIYTDISDIPELSPENKVLESLQSSVKIDYIKKLKEDESGYFIELDGKRQSFEINYNYNGMQNNVDDSEVVKNFINSHKEKLYVIKWSGEISKTISDSNQNVILGISIKWGVQKCPKS